VHSAAAEADRLARITTDLLRLARSDEDQLSLRLEQAEVRPLLARSAELAGPRLPCGRVSTRTGSEKPSTTCWIMRSATLRPDR
jgi:signal transduction histidine kinase